VELVPNFNQRVKAATDMDPRLFRQIFSPWFVILCPQNGIGKGMKKVTMTKLCQLSFMFFIMFLNKFAVIQNKRQMFLPGNGTYHDTFWDPKSDPLFSLTNLNHHQTMMLL
jgi:hypothetical protein